MKNHTLYSEEKTKKEVRFARETKIMEEEGDASIKSEKIMDCEGQFLDNPITKLTNKKVGDAAKHHFFPISDLHTINKKILLDLDLIMKVVGTSMTLESWNFNLLGTETFIQKPLSSPPPPKPPYLNLHAVTSGFPPNDRTASQ